MSVLTRRNSGWIDTAGANDYSGDNFLSGSWHNWRAWTKIRNRSWTGCVESRAGDMSVDDTTPIAGNSLFPPAFAPDEPGHSTYRYYKYEDGRHNYFYNSYLNDSRTNESLDRRQRRQTKYNNASVSTSSRGPSEGCNIQPIQALTNVKAPVLTTINNMQASGYTHVAEGVGWGLRVISPGVPFTEGVDYSDEEITKAMVLLTDGENTFNSESNRNYSTYTAYGFLRPGSPGFFQLLDGDFTPEHAVGAGLQQCSGGRYCDLFVCLQRAECHATQPDQELRYGSGKVLSIRHQMRHWSRTSSRLQTNCANCT